jgi:hypothetical protein
MKVIIALAIALTVSSAFADSPFDAELKELKSQHDKAITEVSEPIHRSYEESLEQLFRRALEANDLDAALKIRLQLAIVPTAAAKKLAGRWNLHTSTGYRATVVLREDGTGTHSGYGDFRWQIAGTTLFFGPPESAADKFELPSQERKLKGVNSLGNVLTLIKQDEP